MLSRGKDGEMYKEICEKNQKLKRHGCRDNRIEFAFAVIRYVFGCRIGVYFHDVIFLLIYSLSRFIKTRRGQDKNIFKGFYQQLIKGKKYYEKNISWERPVQYKEFDSDILYHATPIRNENSIFTDGLKPMSRAFVYMTDRLDFYEERKKWYGEKTVLLSINVKKVVRMGHSIYPTDQGEFVSDFIPYECIEKIAEFDDGIYFEAGKNCLK